MNMTKKMIKQADQADEKKRKRKEKKKIDLKITKIKEQE